MIRINPYADLNQLVVSTEQMRAIEQTMFSVGMPVEALMELVSTRVFERLQVLYPQQRYPQIGVLVGMGHNGGDGLVVARQLALEGRQVFVWLGNPDLKSLTASHARYVSHLRVRFVSDIEDLINCDLLIDAMFGIGMSRPLEDPWAKAVIWANRSRIPIVSIDLPSGLDADTGQPQDSCIEAHCTFCLGLWKRGVWQETALKCLGSVERIDFGVPEFALTAVLGEQVPPRLLTHELIYQWLPSPPDLDTHKYRQGHLLIIGGSKTYAGAVILTALGTRATGVGMTTLVVPESLKMLVHQSVPEVIVQGAAETSSGAIASLKKLEGEPYTAMAIGPGLTSSNPFLVDQWLDQFSGSPLVLDADGLNSLAQVGVEQLATRQAATILTPHLGEFQRLFPSIDLSDRIEAVQAAAQMAKAVVLLKGARTLIADPDGQIWINPDSTPALARGGSGDVLTGMISGLLAQSVDPLRAACLGAWWHSQAALQGVQHRGLTGIDPVYLATILPETIHQTYLAASNQISTV